MSNAAQAAEVASDETNRANALRVTIALLLLLLVSLLTGIPLKVHYPLLEQLSRQITSLPGVRKFS